MALSKAMLFDFITHCFSLRSKGVQKKIYWSERAKVELKDSKHISQGSVLTENPDTIRKLAYSQ